MDFPVLGYVGRVIDPIRYELYLRAHGLLCDFFPDGWPAVLEAIGNDIGDYTVNDIEYRLHGAIINQLESMIRECNVDFHRMRTCTATCGSCYTSPTGCITLNCTRTRWP